MFSPSVTAAGASPPESPKTSDKNQDNEPSDLYGRVLAIKSDSVKETGVTASMSMNKPVVDESNAAAPASVYSAAAESTTTLGPSAPALSSSSSPAPASTPSSIPAPDFSDPPTSSTTTATTTNVSILSDGQTSPLRSELALSPGEIESDVAERVSPLPASTRATESVANTNKAESYFKLRTSASTEGHSPLPRRAPASRCSQGIETASGPPPALSTYPSLTQEVPWTPHLPVTRKRSYNKAQSRSPSVERGRRAISLRLELSPSQSSTPTPQQFPTDAIRSRRRSSLDYSTNNMRSSFGSEDVPEGDRTLRGMDDLGDENEEDEFVQYQKQAHRVPSSSSEDLFLNIARSSSISDRAAAREERRKVSYTKCLRQ